MVAKSNILLQLALIAFTYSQVDAFVGKQTKIRSVDTSVNGIFDKVGEFFEELDAFVDDATSRRLGNGSKFYGKRKSNFYGEKDKDRKLDRSIADPTGMFSKDSIANRLAGFLFARIEKFQ